MKKASFIKQIVLIVMILSFASTAFSAEVLYYVDGDYGTGDMMSLALEKPELNLNVTYVTHPDNFNEFNTLIDSKKWDLVVLAIQQSDAIPSSLDDNKIDEYVNGGGKAIFCSWRKRTPLFAIFGAASTGKENSTEITISPEGLTKGIAPNTLALNECGFGTYTLGMTAINTSEDIVAANFSNGPALDQAAIIISNNGRTIINGFFNPTPEDEAIFVSEIKFLLPDPELESSGGGGCNTGGVVPFALMLLTTLFFFKRKK